MKLFNKKIGVWGYGVVGKSAIRYLSPYAQQLTVYDQKNLASAAQDALAPAAIKIYSPDALVQFLQDNDYIVPSPGIDLRPYGNYKDKFITELDLFIDAWQKPIVSITGSIGKTTVTHVLSHLLQAADKQVATGGNIGTGMLDLLPSQEKSDYAVLELSSFQLEDYHARGPELAIITNIYPNHLDRHGSFEAYCAAKYKMVAQQGATGKALLPFALMHQVRHAVPTKQSFSFFADELPTTALLTGLRPEDTLYYYTPEKLLMQLHAGKHTQLTQQAAPPLTFVTNLLILQTALALLDLDPHIGAPQLVGCSLPAHRLAAIALHDGIEFYNDSKATIPEAMLAAVKKLAGNPILLFLGGVSKGVDRTQSIAELQHAGLKHVFCFGKEAEALQAMCAANNIPATNYTDLQSAFATCLQQYAVAGDKVLFSPAGASFDLFTDYQARGNEFAKLVETYIQKS